MTKLLTATILGAVTALFLATPADAATLAARQRNQSARIRGGIASGQISYGEARSLTRHQRQIHNQILRDRADGRGFTAAERGHANRMLDRQSGRIYHARHNGR
ncbi:MAG TPA: hypothetical protein PKJ41_18425 [Bryobacteraceae bacterium]|nr:hypothetical protein [Bryobacteraceae bacterium]HPT27036.1 hypothetical protein [Bryobacteraceae bacterium]